MDSKGALKIDNLVTVRRNFNKSLAVLANLALTLSLSACAYMKLNQPPDVDKEHPSQNTCGLATASNMLAAAGYGSVGTTQERAELIYSQLTDYLVGYTNEYADNAMTEWLNSDFNDKCKNHIATSGGNQKDKLDPWDDEDVPRIIANHLRDCDFVGLILRRKNTTHGGHEFTVWGDDKWNGKLLTNPRTIRVTDSDRTINGQAIQSYLYTLDLFSVTGEEEKKAWYVNYLPDDPYFVSYIDLLVRTDVCYDQDYAHHALCSCTLPQPAEIKASKLTYRIETSENILRLRPRIDMTRLPSPVVSEQLPSRSVTIEWDFSGKPVSYRKPITFTTDLVLPRGSDIRLKNLHLTYNTKKNLYFPDIGLKLKTQYVDPEQREKSRTGGYFVGSFKIVKPLPNGMNRFLAEFRFIHQYRHDQDPEKHRLFIDGTKDYAVTDLHFGHSYSYLDKKTIWDFDNWLTWMGKKTYILKTDPVAIEIDWSGRLPQPKPIDTKSFWKPHIPPELFIPGWGLLWDPRDEQPD